MLDPRSEEQWEDSPGEGYSPDATPHFLLEAVEEPVGTRLRETFLVSIIVHIAAILFLVTHPELLVLSPATLVAVRPEEKVTLLYEPPQPRREQPQLPPLPKSEGSAETGTKPVPAPQGLEYRSAPPERPVEPRSRERLGEREAEALARELAPIGIPEFPDSAKEPPKQKPALEPLAKMKEAPAPSQAKLQLPSVAPPSRGTDAILREMARQHATGQGSETGSPYVEPDPQNPNFNLPGPQILSDTMGVDFDPYLLRVYLIVRRNWYAVIPEIARLGRQGRVALQFAIQRNGNVPDLVLTSGSGTESMDSAALSSIRLSNPFPPLPPEFPGGEIRLRFVYFYNVRPDY